MIFDNGILKIDQNASFRSRESVNYKNMNLTTPVFVSLAKLKLHQSKKNLVIVVQI